MINRKAENELRYFKVLFECEMMATYDCLKNILSSLPVCSDK